MFWRGVALGAWRGMAFWRALAVFWRGVAFLKGACSVLEGRGILEDTCSILEGRGILEKGVCSVFGGAWHF